MTNNRHNEYDRIAGNRISKLNGGVPRFIALSNQKSITIRNKFARMGLKGSHIDAALKMIDDIGLQETLSAESLGVRFAVVPKAQTRPRIWLNDD